MDTQAINLLIKAGGAPETNIWADLGFLCGELTNLENDLYEALGAGDPAQALADLARMNLIAQAMVSAGSYLSNKNPPSDPQFFQQLENLVKFTDCMIGDLSFHPPDLNGALIANQGFVENLGNVFKEIHQG